MPAAIACYEKWHSDLRHEKADQMHTWYGEDCIPRFLKFLDRKAFLHQKNMNQLTHKPML